MSSQPSHISETQSDSPPSSTPQRPTTSVSPSQPLHGLVPSPDPPGRPPDQHERERDQQIEQQNQEQDQNQLQIASQHRLNYQLPPHQSAKNTRPSNLPSSQFKRHAPLAPATRPVRADILLRGRMHLETGSSALDGALGHALASGRVVQLCGQTLSGKTALAVRLAARVLSTGGGVIWLETTHSTWEVETRLISLAHHKIGEVPSSSFPSSSSSCLPLAVFGVPTYTAVMTTLAAIRDDISLLLALPQVVHKPTAQLADDDALRAALCRLRLVVLDSAAAVLSPLLGLRIPPAWSGHVALDHISGALRWLTVHSNAAVVVTNRVVAPMTAAHPALGNKWAAFVDVSAILSCDTSPSTALHAIVSPTSPHVISMNVRSKRDFPRSCRVVITDDGVCDTP